MKPVIPPTRKDLLLSLWHRLLAHDYRRWGTWIGPKVLDCYLDVKQTEQFEEPPVKHQRVAGEHVHLTTVTSCESF
jgi:hypothetical protein